MSDHEKTRATDVERETARSAATEQAVDGPGAVEVEPDRSAEPPRARAHAGAAGASPVDDEPDARGAAQPADADEGEGAGGALEVEGGALEVEGGALEVEGDLDELVKLTAQRDEYLSLAQRTQADFENYKKRVARGATQAVERGVVKLVKELLPALDNLDRAIAAAASEDPLLEGVHLVRAEIAAALARVGVESYSPLGEQFDPSLHEAVATVQEPHAGAASGSVAEVFGDGYRLGETIIRPARVVVVA
jgi:molecular chaperone GrpE